MMVFFQGFGIFVEICWVCHSFQHFNFTNYILFGGIEVNSFRCSWTMHRRRISLSDLRWVWSLYRIVAKYEMFFLSLGSRIYKVPGNIPNQFSRRALSMNLMEKKIWSKNINFSWRNLKMKIFGPKIFFELRNF